MENYKAENKTNLDFWVKFLEFEHLGTLGVHKRPIRLPSIVSRNLSSWQPSGLSRHLDPLSGWRGMRFKSRGGRVLFY